MMKPSPIDEYLSTLADAERKVLDVVRDTISSVNPDLQERMSSGAPFFWYRGRRAVGFGAAKSHLSFYIMHGAVLETFRKELVGHDVSRTVIRFTPQNPLARSLIRRLVRARLAEIAQRGL